MISVKNLPKFGETGPEFGVIWPPWIFQDGYLLRNYLDVDDLLTRWGIWRSQGVKILSVRARTIFSSLPPKRVNYQATCEACHGHCDTYCRECRGRGTVSRTYDAVDPRLISATDGGNGPVFWGQPPAEYPSIDRIILRMPVSVGACLTAQYVYYPGRYQHQRRVSWCNERLEAAHLSKIDSDQEFKRLLKAGKRIIADSFNVPMSQFTECRRKAAYLKHKTSDAVVLMKPPKSKRPVLHLPKTA